MSNIQHVMRIERNDYMINLIGVVPNKIGHSHNVLLRPRHEQSAVGMAKIELSVDNKKRIFHAVKLGENNESLFRYFDT